ncbi:protein phosphatase 1 regulatory subunit 12A isoform X1 [Amphiprion ocellaris]|uniref:protein phosphatase 1 regulatory subunit 12A isoform X1 n=1 Tax=Amphiprion ocellaris TaxID=80972 RepID=UPI000C311E10|nr:protein phosphatase 1 regulatory subunit 12A isoform X1 [Amphiprion ocellaris]XP_054868810.1 protein phosphatase 1 regulatory subunit 12A isoform X1 [Amphiprion ocellaris]
MQAFAPRLYLTPVRDEEAESQRKAKSRHARQTRRSTQGVTLTDLNEAKKTNSLSPQDREKEEGGPLDDRSCLRKGFPDDRRVKIGLTESADTAEISLKCTMDEEGNIEPRLETLAESPDPTYLSAAGSCGVPYCNSSYRVGERWWRDENQNPVEDAAQLAGDATQQRHHCCDVEDSDYKAEHDRLSRYDSSGESATDKPMGRTSSYTRRETRLAALNRQEQDSTAKDYKKMYAEALHENERLKSRLHDSKQELVKIRSQLEKVTQRHDRISERSTVLESEKREKQALEKRVSDMEEEIKAFPALAQVQALRRVNECLLAENRAMLRVLARLSETASMPETEDL